MREYQDQLMKDFEAGFLSAEMKQEWMLNLEPLVEEVEDKEAVGKTLTCILEREPWAMRGELSNGHSIYMLDTILIWVMQTLDKLSSNFNPQINLGNMIVMAYSHQSYTSWLLINVTVEKPAEMNHFKLWPYFVDKMDAIFEIEEEKQHNVPT